MISEIIYCIGSQKVHTVELRGKNENAIVCPECSHSRKKKTDKCLGYNYEKEIGHCNHCEERFVKYKEFEKKQDYFVPEFDNRTELSDKAVQWFLDKRLIGQTTLSKMNVSSCSEFMPQTGKEMNCIAFPFYRNSKLVNVKFRDGKKNFKLSKGAEVIWYNYDAIKSNEVIITEGEIDALTFINDGFDNVISVPNGASVGSMDYLNIEELKHVEQFYLAVDNDSKGLQLRNEFVRRLGAERCKVCTFKEYKDANEYYVKNGHGSLKDVLDNAKHPKVEDVITLEDFEKDADYLLANGLVKGLGLGINKLDDHIRFETSRVMVVTGVPSSGKSNFVDFINCRLNVLYGWKVGYWSPESAPYESHLASIESILVGKTYDAKYIKPSEHINAKNHIRKNFFWINPDNVYETDPILAKFEFMVKAHGVKIVCIDPFTNISTDEPNERKFIKDLLNKLTRFAKKFDVLVQLVAHPKKMERNKEGVIPIPSMYDISGSADFWNKCDYGIALGREYDIENRKLLSNGTVVVHKVKLKTLGETGAFDFDYDVMNNRYRSQYKESDISSWLESNEPTQIELIENNDQDIKPYNPEDDIPF